jgi:signal transduction histidine kinase
MIDSGQGMSSEVLAHAADPHFSTKDTRRHKGLGLSTVFAIMREHEGFMTIESKIGKGTCVSLYFPLLKSDTANTHKPPRGAEDAAPSPDVENTSEDNKV